MSQQNRRFLAAACLAAALTLAMPSPSRAVGLREVGGAAALAVRAWAWLESLGFGVRPAPARRPSARWEKQGSAIDPNGATARVATRTTSSPDGPSEQGSAIDPNGLQ